MCWDHMHPLSKLDPFTIPYTPRFVHPESPICAAHIFLDVWPSTGLPLTNQRLRSFSPIGYQLLIAPWIGMGLKLAKMEEWGSKFRDPGAIDSTLLYSISECFHLLWLTGTPLNPSTDDTKSDTFKSSLGTFPSQAEFWWYHLSLRESVITFKCINSQGNNRSKHIREAPLKGHFKSEGRGGRHSQKGKQVYQETTVATQVVRPIPKDKRDYGPYGERNKTQYCGPGVLCLLCDFLSISFWNTLWAFGAFCCACTG